MAVGPDDLRRASAYFPLVGLGVAGVGVAARAAAAPLWGAAVATLAAIVAMIVVTGAFHEDGLADTADGLWGGWTPAGRLAIMRDSRIGTYGTIALVAAFSLRAGLLLPLDLASFARAVACGHVLARASSLLLARLLPAVASSSSTVQVAQQLHPDEVKALDVEPRGRPVEARGSPPGAGEESAATPGLAPAAGEALAGAAGPALAAGEALAGAEGPALAAGEALAGAEGAVSGGPQADVEAFPRSAASVWLPSLAEPVSGAAGDAGPSEPAHPGSVRQPPARARAGGAEPGEHLRGDV
jgi:adenosylcobinamide-GDP ribazoletransferase